MTARPNTAAELARLSAMLEAKMAADERDRVEAKEQRDAMSKDIHAIRSNATAIDNRVSRIEQDMTEVKPVIASLVNGKAKVTGAVIVLGAIGSVVLGFLTYFKSQITSLIWGA